MKIFDLTKRINRVTNAEKNFLIKVLQMNDGHVEFNKNEYPIISVKPAWYSKECFEMCVQSLKLKDKELVITGFKQDEPSERLAIYDLEDVFIGQVTKLLMKLPDMSADSKVDCMDDDSRVAAAINDTLSYLYDDMQAICDDELADTVQDLVDKLETAKNILS